MTYLWQAYLLLPAHHLSRQAPEVEAAFLLTIRWLLAARLDLFQIFFSVLNKFPSPLRTRAAQSTINHACMFRENVQEFLSRGSVCCRPIRPHTPAFELFERTQISQIKK